MADVDRVLQAQVGRQGGEIVGVVIHVVTVGNLTGAAMPPTIMGYDAIALLYEEQHLVIPIIGRQRPAVTEHDRLTLAPILVEDLNAVFGRDRAHVMPSFSGCALRIKEA